MLRPMCAGVAAVMVSVCGLAAAQGPLTTEVSYQGRLTDGGLTPTGVYDLQFRLFDDPAAGSQVGNTAFEDNVQVTGGLFTASPDFGPDAFSASKQLWVQVEVRPGASAGAFTPLLPRQRMLSAPVASSLRLPLVMNTDPGTINMFDLSRSGEGRVMQLQQNAPGGLYHAMRVDGNSATNSFGAYSSGGGGAIYASSSGAGRPTVQVDNSSPTGTPSIRVNVYDDNSGLVVDRGGSPAATTPGVSVLLDSTAANVLGGDYRLTGDAGSGAAALKGAVLGANANSQSIGVQGVNTKGIGVDASSTSGIGLDASSSSGYAINAQTASGSYAVFAVNSTGSAGVGGVIDDPASTLGNAGVLGWQRASTGSGYGLWGYAQSPSAIALRVERNALTGTSPAAYITNPSTSIQAYGVHSVMTSTTGGASSTALRGESQSTSGGGIGVWGSHAGTGWGVYGSAGPGGYGVRGSAGTDVNDNGWAGYFGGQVYISSQLGLGVLTPAFPIEHSSGARLTASGVWTNASDRNLKENITPVDPSDVLARVVSMPVSVWNYKVDAEAKHIGPMAQDFKQAFGLGDSDKVIGTVDADGVALAAIQGLNKKLEAKDAEIDALKTQMNAQNAANEARIKALEEAIAKVIAAQKEGAR